MMVGVGRIWPPKLGLSSTFSPRTRMLPTTVCATCSTGMLLSRILPGSATKVFTKGS